MDNPESRFFIDHGVVHDRKTGKHVRCGCFPYEGTVDDFLKLLQELESAADPCASGCQYAKDVGMPEHSCGNVCQYKLKAISE